MTRRVFPIRRYGVLTVAVLLLGGLLYIYLLFSSGEALIRYHCNSNGLQHSTIESAGNDNSFTWSFRECERYSY